jgi:hypothetical protein
VAQSATAQLEVAMDGSVAGSRAAAGLEESLWLCPIENRRRLDSIREGMQQGFSVARKLGRCSRTSGNPSSNRVTRVRSRADNSA